MNVDKIDKYHEASAPPGGGEEFGWTYVYSFVWIFEDRVRSLLLYRDREDPVVMGSWYQEYQEEGDDTFQIHLWELPDSIPIRLPYHRFPLVVLRGEPSNLSSNYAFCSFDPKLSQPFDLPEAMPLGYYFRRAA